MCLLGSRLEIDLFSLSLSLSLRAFLALSYYYEALMTYHCLRLMGHMQRAETYKCLLFFMQKRKNKISLGSLLGVLSTTFFSIKKILIYFCLHNSQHPLIN